MEVGSANNPSPENHHPSCPKAASLPGASNLETDETTTGKPKKSGKSESDGDEDDAQSFDFPGNNSFADSSGADPDSMLPTRQESQRLANHHRPHPSVWKTSMDESNDDDLESALGDTAEWESMESDLPSWQCGSGNCCSHHNDDDSEVEETTLVWIPHTTSSGMTPPGQMNLFLLTCTTLHP